MSTGKTSPGPCAVFRRPVLPEDEGRYHFEGMRQGHDEALALIERLSERDTGYFTRSNYVILGYCASAPTLSRERDEAVELLRELEWAGFDPDPYEGGGEAACPSCGGDKPDPQMQNYGGHRDGCKLAGFLARIGGAATP